MRENQAEAEFRRSLEGLLKTIREKCESQFKYNVETNVPKGIVEIDDAAEHAVNTGLVSALGNHVQWDPTEALELAGNIAEDVNAHEEAKQIRAMNRYNVTRDAFVASAASAVEHFGEDELERFAANQTKGKLTKMDQTVTVKIGERDHEALLEHFKHDKTGKPLVAVIERVERAENFDPKKFTTEECEFAMQCMNTYGDEGHPVADLQSLQYFKEHYVLKCVLEGALKYQNAMRSSASVRGPFREFMSDY